VFSAFDAFTLYICDTGGDSDHKFYRIVG